MKQTFIFSNRRYTWKNPPFDDILLMINDRDAGKIDVHEGQGKFFLVLHVYDDCWTLLPVLAADLYLHSPGCPPCGYATKEAALLAAVDILKCHGWIDITEEDLAKNIENVNALLSQNTEAGFVRRECLIVSSGVVSIGFMLVYLLGVDLLWCMAEILKTLSLGC